MLPDFSEFCPGKFTNVTNGVTPRRFVRLANPALSELITDALGVGWLTDLERLARARAVRRGRGVPRRVPRGQGAQQAPAQPGCWRERDGIDLPDGHLLDVMVKRLHEYKRQTLKVLHIVTAVRADHLRARWRPPTITPRTFIFGAKAAPGYRMAKETIHLINGVGAVVNTDPRVEGRLKVRSRRTTT